MSTSFKFLDDIGLDAAEITNPEYQFPFITEYSLSNGVVLDLHNLARKLQLQLGPSLSTWISRLCQLPSNTIPSTSSSPFLTKVYRTTKTYAQKRGQARAEYLTQQFHISPTSTSVRPQLEQPDTSQPATLSAHDTVQTPTTSSRSSEEKLQERREKVKSIQKQHTLLKRKHTRLVSACAEMKDKRIKLQKDVLQAEKAQHLSEKAASMTDIKCKRLQLKGDKYFKLYRIQQREMKVLKETILSHEGKMQQLQAKSERDDQAVANSQKENEKLRESLKESKVSLEYLQSLLSDHDEVELYDNETRSYKPETMKCVMDLTDMKVPVDKVGRVIVKVMSMCGRRPNALPSTTTINRMVDSKGAIAHAQLASVLPSAPDMTLYTDETRKYGRTVETYIVTDQSQTSYVLGLREMANKSGQTTLDTFIEVLNDISNHCHLFEIKGDLDKIGYKILSNIRDTMSDRASTETNFNKLLHTYRESILPKVIDGWVDMSENERELCSKINNFFCGLHLMCGMADSCEETIKRFENATLGDEMIGSAKNPELKRYHKNESGTLRLTRTCCKAFATGEDEKNGVSQDWKTYLKDQGKDRNKVVRFKHNRFNLVFYLGHAIFFHHQDMTIFLENVHGSSNNLLKAVALDVKEPLYLAGLRAFGMISKFISAPLWRLLESEGHILSMNEHYQRLVHYLDVCSDSTEKTMKFMKGEDLVFERDSKKEDKVLEYLLEEDQATDRFLCPMLQQLFKTISQLLKRMVTDHLPSGKFWSPTACLSNQSESTLKHNKLPEFIFGQLDQLLRYRPNATLLTNEAYLMYSHNKTSEWIDNLDEEERDRLLNESRKMGRQTRMMFKERMDDIERLRLEQKKRKQLEMEERERKKIKAAEELTLGVCFYGLWQSAEQIDEALNQIPTAQEKRNAIASQLKFRNKILKQKHPEPRIYNFSQKDESGKYKNYSIEKLKHNLLLLIRDVMTTPTTEKISEGIPLLVNKRIEHKFKEGAYMGKVISVVPGFPEWYNVKYDNDVAVYAYNLKEDYQKGDLKIVVEESHDDH